MGIIYTLKGSYVNDKIVFKHNACNIVDCNIVELLVSFVSSLWILSILEVKWENIIRLCVDNGFISLSVLNGNFF